MKKLLTISFILISLGAFTQSDKDTLTPKRGTIKVQKKNTGESIQVFQQNNDLNTPPVIRMPNNNIGAGIIPCLNDGWLNGKWIIKGFPKEINRAYYFDTININCSDVTVEYTPFNSNNLPNKKGVLFQDVENRAGTEFDFLEFNFDNETIKFYYTYKNETNRKQLGAMIVIDTLYQELTLTNNEKNITFTIYKGKNGDIHNYFPGLCKKADKHVHKWISTAKDYDGFGHVITFNSCTQINIVYHNPLTENITEPITIFNKGNEFFLNISRHEIDKNKLYFDTEYKIIFEEKDGEELLLLERQGEVYTYKIYNKTDDDLKANE